jgi:hypothetical protein
VISRSVSSGGVASTHTGDTALLTPNADNCRGWSNAKKRRRPDTSVPAPQIGVVQDFDSKVSLGVVNADVHRRVLRKEGDGLCDDCAYFDSTRLQPDFLGDEIRKLNHDYLST